MAKKARWASYRGIKTKARKRMYKYTLTMDDGREIKFKTEEEVLKAIGVMADLMADEWVSSSEDFTRENAGILMSR